MKQENIVLDASEWEEMDGSSNLEKKINSYLTCQFVNQFDVLSDECLSHARKLMKIIYEELD